MIKIAQDILTKVSQNKENGVRKGIDLLAKIWYGPNKFSINTSKEEIENVLAMKFPTAKSIKVEDVTGGDGAIYEIYVEDNNFQGLSILKQHQAITDALKDQIKLVHGIRIITKVPKNHKI